MRSICLWATSLLLVCFSICPPAGAADRASGPAFKPGEVLVGFRPAARRSAGNSLLTHLQLQPVQALDSGRIQLLKLPEQTSVEKAVALLQADDTVAFAEPNYLLYAQEMADDVSFADQWGLHNTGQQVGGYVGTPGADIDAIKAWDLTTGQGSLSLVAILDTGVNTTHPDLAANIWVNSGETAGNGMDDDGNGFVDDTNGWDFVSADNQPQDADGHGTHVAGIIAARGNNAMGTAGVAWDTRMMPLRVLDAFGVGTTADAIAAIDYALANGAKIINCSWGGPGNSLALKQAMEGADALFVCAAGNEGADNDAVGFYPAAYDLPNILSVAATDQMDRLTWFSNFGGSVDVAAPGIRIFSTISARRTLWQETFDTGDLSHWTTGGSGAAWGVATPIYTQSTQALADSPLGDYEAETDTWIATPPVDLTHAAGCLLTFRVIGISQAGADRLGVEISADGGAWTPRPLKLGTTVVSNGISGTIAYWMPVSVDLGDWDGVDRVSVRFRFTTDAQVNAAGFFIDDVSLTAASDEARYGLMRGTSMAAGFVSGIAALLQSTQPAITIGDLKQRLVESVDLDSTLAGMIDSGGRVNAFNALTLLDSLLLSASTTPDNRIALDWAGDAAPQSLVRIERRAEGQNDFTTLAVVPAADDSFADNSVAPQMTYYYRVFAESLDGRTGFSPQTRATTTAASSGDSSGGGGGGGCFIRTLFDGLFR